jgi:hypothetical protein
MQLYGVYRDYGTGHFVVGMVSVLKETNKYYLMDRHHAFEFACRIEKPIALANHATHALAVESKRRQLEDRIDRASVELQKAELTFAQFNADMTLSPRPRLKERP